MNDTLDHKYLFVLAAVAVAVLITGALLKPAKQSKTDPPPPSETASLQRLVRREELQRLAGTFAERALSFADAIVFLPGQRSSSVRWDAEGEVVAPGTDLRRPLVKIATDSRVPPRYRRDPDESAAGWVLVVAKDEHLKPLWTAAIDSGSHSGECGDLRFRERVLGNRLGRQFAGAGVFNLDGALVGVVARCGDDYPVIEAASIPTVLSSTSKADMLSVYGIQVEPITTETIFSMPTGLLVTRLNRADGAFDAGLRAGDLIAAMNNTPVHSEKDFFLSEAASLDGVTLTVYRAGKTTPLRLSLPARSQLEGLPKLGLKAVGTTKASLRAVIAAGTPAYDAGLRNGDIILQIGKTRNPTEAQFRRELPPRTEQAVLVVFEREGVEYAAWMKS